MGEVSDGLIPTETFSNIRLGKKMMLDLVEYMGRDGRIKKREIGIVLNRFADVVEDVLLFRRDNIEEPYGMPYGGEQDARRNFQFLTAEERALAAGYAMARCLQSTKDTRSDHSLMKSYELNRKRAVDKGRNAGLTNMRNLSDYIPTDTCQIMTGTTESRITNVEAIVRAILMDPPHPGDFLESRTKEKFADMVLARDIDDKAELLLKSNLSIARESLGRVVDKGLVGMRG